ncbi:MAG TPA: hypothetical protein VLS90_01065 [Thermodesulfobacteriota bacterium]|nr:hypothetical protein [Thermodesulfobacteriota bacterium]
MKPLPPRFVLILFFVLFPRAAHAHNPGAIILAGITPAAAGAATLVKSVLFDRIFRAAGKRRFALLLGLGAIELAILLAALPAAFYLSSSRHTHALLMTATLIYWAIAVIPNDVYLKRIIPGNGRSGPLLARSLIAAVLFPAVLWTLVLTSLATVYELLGG